MPGAVAEQDRVVDAAEDEHPETSGDGLPNWRVLPPVPITNLRIMASTDVPESLRRHILDPTVLEEHKPFTMTAIGSNQVLDAYSTRMMDSSLRNYAADAADGRALLDSHRWRELPIGKTYDGRFKDGRGGGLGKRAEMDAYILPGHTAGRGGDTDSIINHIRAGIYSDVSIGFQGGKMMCSICGLEMMDPFFAWLFFDEEDARADVCMHIAGVEYAKKGKDGKATDERETAVGEIEDAHLRELSIVYDGATPGAAITKARAMAEAGILEPDVARQLESIYHRQRVTFPKVQRLHAIPRLRAAPAEAAAVESPRDETKPGDREVTMSEPETSGASPAPDPLEPIRALVREVGWAPEGTWDGDVATVIRARAATAKETAADAAAGRQYKADLVKFALDEGVRARGDKFNREKWEPILRTADPDTIRLYMEDWGIDARAFFVAGRGTVETDEQPKPAAGAIRLPRPSQLAAYTG